MTNTATPGAGSQKEERKFDPLAVERTELALERTHLAWIRTIVGLITSGFAIDKLVEAFREKRLITGEALVSHAHVTGLVLTVTGTLLMILVTIYYIKRSRKLAVMRGEGLSRLPPGLALSVFIFFIGLVLIYLIIISD